MKLILSCIGYASSLAVMYFGLIMVIGLEPSVSAILFGASIIVASLFAVVGVHSLYNDAD